MVSTYSFPGLTIKLSPVVSISGTPFVKTQVGHCKLSETNEEILRVFIKS